MINSKLVIILKSFTIKEIKELHLFINSPLFNKNKDVLKLLSILKKYYPFSSTNNFSHALIAQKLFGKPDVKKLRYTMTELSKLLEKYIAFKKFEKDEEIYLIKAYQERGLTKYFKQETEKANHQLTTKTPLRNDEYYRYKYELNELSYQYTLENDNRNIDVELQAVVDNLDVFYLSKKLKYSCEIINRMNILKVAYDINLLNNLLDYIKVQDLKKVPSVMVYYQVLATLQEPKNEKNYVELKKVVIEHLDKFKKDEQYDLYGYLQNYCIKKINSGNNNYLQLLFENYNEMIVNKVVIKNNLIAQFDFKNIVTVALRVEEYNWTENFINKYQIYLPNDHNINAVNYNLARLFFYQKNYKLCLKQLLSVEFTDIYYSLDSRVLLLKTYYEMDDLESASSLINAFKIFLKRDNTISEYQNLTYTNFLQLIYSLVRLKMGYIKDLGLIEDKLNKTEQIADLTWLKQKVKELK